MACPGCGQETPAGGAFCTRCGAPLGGNAPLAPGGAATAAPPARPRTCVNCHTQMQYVGQPNFRAGGYVGGTGLLIGGWNQLAENLLAFSLYYCPTCGKVDLYYPGT